MGGPGPGPQVTSSSPSHRVPEARATPPRTGHADGGWTARGPAPSRRPRGPRRHFIGGRLEARRGGPRSLRAQSRPPPSWWLQRARCRGRGGRQRPPMGCGRPGTRPPDSCPGLQLRSRARGCRRAGGRAGCGQPQTKVAWCGLALGLAGPPVTGLGPGRSGAGVLLACGLRGPVHTPGALKPGPGAEPATKSTSMIVLTGRPRLLGALPPVTGRRERLSPSPPGLQTPRRGPHPPALHGHWPWQGFLKCPQAGHL